jgi:hypothetical protein
MVRQVYYYQDCLTAYVIVVSTFGHFGPGGRWRLLVGRNALPVAPSEDNSVNDASNPPARIGDPDLRDRRRADGAGDVRRIGA